jgi:hypothetical protein
MEHHHFSWENPLFLWSFSIAMLNYQRVIYTLVSHHIQHIYCFSERVDVKPPTGRRWISLTMSQCCGFGRKSPDICVYDLVYIYIDILYTHIYI